jgi:hypothetical protein
MHKLFLSIVGGVALSCLPALALAQEAPMMPPSVEPPPPPSAVAPGGEYVTPLRQNTQQTYVPQSVALSGPSVIQDWEDGEPIPPGYHRRARTRSGLIVAGSVTLGSLWLISAVIGATSVDSCRYGGCQSAGFLFVPVIGPFIEMGRTGKGSATGELMLAVDGLGQAAGAAMLIGGMSSPKIVLVRNDLASEPPKLAVQPYFTGRSAGLRGSF